jgi:hypothetical protein
MGRHRKVGRPSKQNKNARRRYNSIYHKNKREQTKTRQFYRYHSMVRKPR